MSAVAGRGVLVTGGLGFIGSNLAARCAALGARVRVLDASLPNTGADPRNLDGVEAEVDAGDVRDAEAVRRCLDGVEIVFHCAALSSHPRSMRDPLAAADVNHLGTLALLEAVRAHRPSAVVVHVGTTTQIGRLRSAAADEGHPQAPLDLYSASKVAAEVSARAYAQALAIRVAILRLPNVYGPRARTDDPGLSFANYFVGCGLRGAPLTVYRPGEQRRSFLYVDDAVDALLAAADRVASDAPVWHAAGEAHHSVVEFARAVESEVGGFVEWVEWPSERRSIEVGDQLLDARRTREALGWAPRVGLHEGLRRTATWFRDAGRVGK
jgi:UDP-glucose 4-epimerase